MKTVLLIIFLITLPIVAVPEDLFTFSADVDFRFRGEFGTTTDINDDESTLPNESYQLYANKLGWNTFLTVAPHDKFQLRFRLSNPVGYILETVYTNAFFVDYGSIVGVAVPQAELYYAPGKFSLSAGVLAVYNSSVLTIATGAENDAYKSRFTLSESWKYHTNESQVGARVSWDFSNVATHLTYGVISYTKATDSTEHATAHRFILDVPIELNTEKKMLLQPSLVLRTHQNNDPVNPTTSLHGGVDFKTQINKTFSLLAGVGYGAFKAQEESDERHSGGMVLLSSKAKFKIHTIHLGYSFSAAHNATEPGITRLYQNLDVSWKFTFHKFFSLKPRFRWWLDSEAETGSSFQRLRPELILLGHF